MAPRADLQTLLEVLLGSEQVFFQAPGAQGMAYPAIVYKLDGIPVEFANNIPYNVSKRYQVTLITRLPNENFVDALAVLPMCVFQRHYVADNLNHYVFNLYF